MVMGMVYILLIFYILIVIFVYAQSKKFYSPLIIYTLFWSFIIFLSTLNLFDFFPVRNETYYIFLGGIFFFLLGYLLQYYYFSKVNKWEKSRSDASSFQISYRMETILLLIALLFLLTRVSNLLNLLRSGNTVEAIRYMFYEYESNDASSRYVYYFQNMIVTPIIFASAVLTVLDFFMGKKKKTWILAVVVTVLYILISGGGRVVIMNYIFHFVFMMMIMKRRINISKKARKRILTIVIGSVIGFLAINSFRGKETALQGMLYEAYKYYAGCIKHFEIRIDRLGDTRDHGIAFLSGYLRPLFLLLGIVGISPPSNYNIYLYQNSLLQSGVQIGKDTWYNAFATLNYHFYLGFGKTGVMIGNFLYGMLCSYTMTKQERQRNMFAVGVLLLILQGILTSMVRWQFSIPSYALSFVFLRLMLNKTYTDREGNTQ